VDDPASVVGQDDQYEQHMEANRRDGEEVQRYQLLGVVGQEGPPRRRRRLARTDPVLVDRGLGDIDAQLPKLALDTGRSPGRRMWSSTFSFLCEVRGYVELGGIALSRVGLFVVSFT
jgi:hypothetical protein